MTFRPKMKRGKGISPDSRYDPGPQTDPEVRALRRWRADQDAQRARIMEKRRAEVLSV